MNGKLVRAKGKQIDREERNWIYKEQWLLPSWRLKGVQGQLEVTLRMSNSNFVCNVKTHF